MNWLIGQGYQGGTWNGAVSELWAHGAYLPWATYGSSFYNGSCPLDLGTNGEGPTGSAPSIGYWPDGNGTTNASNSATAIPAMSATGTPTATDGPCP